MVKLTGEEQRYLDKRRAKQLELAASSQPDTEEESAYQTIAANLLDRAERKLQEEESTA